MYSLTFSANPTTEEEQEADSSSAVFYSSCSPAVLSAARRELVSASLFISSPHRCGAVSHTHPGLRGCARGVGADPGGCCAAAEDGARLGRLCPRELGACPPRG